MVSNRKLWTISRSWSRLKCVAAPVGARLTRWGGSGDPSGTDTRPSADRLTSVGYPG